jgi:hypothetical protein
MDACYSSQETTKSNYVIMEKKSPGEIIVGIIVMVVSLVTILASYKIIRSKSI